MQDVRKDADSSMLTQSLIAAVFLLWSAHATPTGNHTCTGVVKHEVTVRVNVTEPVTFRAYEWCLRVPPRCSTYTIQLKDRVKIHKEMHNRTITVCCKGYVEIDYKCVPACPPETECPNMHCNRTNHCYCTPGYTGLYCNHPCPKGTWGAACIKPCDCPPGYTCHHLTGDCMIDDSPPLKTRRTTTAEYLTEAATTLDTTHPTTRTPTTVTTTQPTTTPTSTTTTTTTTTAPTTRATVPTATTTTATTTTTTTSTTTERPTSPTTTTTTTETPTTPTTTTTAAKETTPTPWTTKLVTQPLPTMDATPQQTTTTTEQATTTTEQITTPQTKPTTITVSTMKHKFDDKIVTIIHQTTEPIPVQQEIFTEKIAVQNIPAYIQTTTTESTTSTATTTTLTQPTPTDISTVGIPTTTKHFPAHITTAFQSEPTKTSERKIEVTTSTTTSTTPKTTTLVPTSEQTTTTSKPTASSILKTNPTTSTTQATVQTTLITTQLPTTTTTESLPTTETKSLQTEQTFITPPKNFDREAVTVQTSTSTDLTQTTTLATTITTSTEPTTQSTTPPTTKPSTTATTSSTTSRPTEAEVTTTTTFVTAPPEENEEALKTSTTTNTPLFEKKELGVWDTKHLEVETTNEQREKGSHHSVAIIGSTEQHIVTTSKSELSLDKNEKERALEKGVENNDKKLDRNSGEVLTTTTDRLDRMIIEDIPKPLAPEPTTDNSPIKLVEEVISKYFPETLLKPNKAPNNEQDKIPENEKPEVQEKAIVTPWLTETRGTRGKVNNAETTITLGTQEETKSHPRTEVTTTTIPPPTTPDITTIPIITPKVIVSAKNPDEIDLGGVIYRKMKFFPPAMKQTEDLHKQTSPPPTIASVNEHSAPFKETTTAIGDRFKIYLPEYEKSTEKADEETTEATTVRTFLPKFNFDKEDFDYGKQPQTKKVKQKDKEIKKYKIKPNEPTAATSAEEGDNDRVTNNVFLQTREFKVHLATTKAAKFGDGFYTKTDQDSAEFGKFQKKKPKYGLPEYEPTKFVKYTVPPDSQDFEEGTKDGNFPTTNAKPPHTWYSHVREKAKIKNAFKVMKSTIGLDLNAKPTEESVLEESNDIHSMATQFTEREPRSAAVTYQDDLNNPQMFGQVKFNAPEGFLSSIADDGAKSGIFASLAVGGSCFVAMATLVAVVWLRLKGRARPRESSVSFEDGDPVRIGQPNGIGDYETVYPIANESDEMEVATFFCPTFTNNYAERINREFKEMSYDHPRSSVAEPLYAEILHPKIKNVADQ